MAAEDAPQLSSSSTSASAAKQRPASTTGGAPVCANPQVWGEEVRGLFAAMLGKPKLASGFDDFVSFGLYWDAVRRGDAKVAGKLADARDKI